MDLEFREKTIVTLLLSTQKRKFQARNCQTNRGYLSLIVRYNYVCHGKRNSQ